jgi:RHS repeat-associated protein
VIGYHANYAERYNYFRDYDPTTGRYVESDPIGLRAGLNTYMYVGGEPLSATDPSGLLEQCRSGLDALGGGSAGPLHHEFLCWTGADGKRQCRGYGRDPGSRALGAMGGRVKGKILKDGENISYGKSSCEPDDKNSCMDRCAERKWKELENKTPRYGWVFGTQCVVEKRVIYNLCSEECGLSSPPPNDYFGSY